MVSMSGVLVGVVFARPENAFRGTLLGVVDEFQSRETLSSFTMLLRWVDRVFHFSSHDRKEVTEVDYFVLASSRT
jgi:hypothetical protein